MIENRPVVGVVGATGVVGREILALLEERAFPAATVRVFASSRSARERLEFGGREVVVETLADGCFVGVDLAFFAAGAAVATRHAPEAVAAGAVVVDTSGAFAGDPTVPLVVPEIDAASLARHAGVVASPTSGTVQLALTLLPLAEAAGLRRVFVSTYQSASGAGRRAMDELREQTVALLSFREPTIEAFPRRLAFDCVPAVGQVMPEGDTRDERRLVAETRRVLALPDLAVGATCVQVPVFVGDAMAVHVETERPLSPAAALEALAGASWLSVEPDPEDFPTAHDAAGREEILVGRVRRDGDASGLALWCVADNVRRGAAGNAVRIAERLHLQGLGRH